MDKELHIIHLDDYLNHIDNKLEMYELLLEMVRALRSDLENGECAQAVRTLCGYEQQAHEMFEAWGIPDEFVQTGEPHHLAQLMEDELLPCDDEGEHRDGDDYSDDAEDTLLSVQLLRVAAMLSDGASHVLEVCQEVMTAEQAAIDGLAADLEKPENDCAG